MEAKAMVASALAVLSAAATAAGLALNGAAGAHATSLFPGPSVALAALAAPVGAFLLGRQRKNLVAWLLVAGGSSLAAYVLFMGLGAFGSTQGWDAGRLGWVVWFSSWTWLGGLVLTGFLPQVFPTGRPLPGRPWRAWWRLSLACGAGYLLLCMLVPGTTEFPGAAHPFVPPDAAAATTVAGGIAVVLVSTALAVLSLASIIARYRRSHGAERRRNGLVALALALLNIAILTNSSWFQLLCTLFLLASFILSATMFGLFGTPPPQWGTSSGNSSLLAAVEQIARHAATPATALAEAAGAVNNALRASSLTVREGAPGAPGTPFPRDPLHAGHPPGLLPLTWAREPVGWLELAAPAGLRVPARDLRTVTALVPSFSVLVREAALSAELERSRHAVVNEREGERRRIRRELHDGLGPLLAGAALSLGAAGTALAALGQETATVRARSLLDDAAADLREAVAAVRGLAYGLRPPALDDAGLLAAVQRLTGDLAVPVTVTATGGLDDLPAAVEAAAFRIASEALRNIVRHAQAGRADVVLHRTGSQLTVIVTDDGVGPGTSAGVGVLSMAEFAAEVGGRCQLRSGVPRGTVVEAVLPLSPATASGPDGGHHG